MNGAHTLQMYPAWNTCGGFGIFKVWFTGVEFLAGPDFDLPGGLVWVQ